MAYQGQFSGYGYISPYDIVDLYVRIDDLEYQVENLQSQVDDLMSFIADRLIDLEEQARRSEFAQEHFHDYQADFAAQLAELTRGEPSDVGSEPARSESSTPSRTETRPLHRQFGSRNLEDMDREELERILSRASPLHRDFPGNNVEDAERYTAHDQHAPQFQRRAYYPGYGFDRFMDSRRYR